MRISDWSSDVCSSDLARARGWRICLIEPFAPGGGSQPSYDARSTALSYGSRLIYQRLGLWPAIAQRAEPLLLLNVFDRGRFAEIGRASWRVRVLQSVYLSGVAVSLKKKNDATH